MSYFMFIQLLELTEETHFHPVDFKEVLPEQLEAICLAQEHLSIYRDGKVLIFLGVLSHRVYKLLWSIHLLWRLFNL